MLLYYITDRRQFSGNQQQQRRSLLARIAEAARCGVDFIQLRERDLPLRDLESLAREAMQRVRDANALHHDTPTRLLINSRTDIALAVGADGVHLRSDDLSPGEVRYICAKTSNFQFGFKIAVSCHTPAEVRMAEAQGADFAVFGPIFGKVTAPQHPAIGTQVLLEACRRAAAAPNVEGLESGRMPVLALGGVTLENASSCLHAGASGIAAIRLFQDQDIRKVVTELRRLDRS